jgi:hypothetical protein
MYDRTVRSINFQPKALGGHFRSTTGREIIMNKGGHFQLIKAKTWARQIGDEMGVPAGEVGGGWGEIFASQSGNIGLL